MSATSELIVDIPAPPEEASELEQFVSKAETLSDEEALSMLPELVEVRDFATLQLGGLLSVVYRNGHWKKSASANVCGSFFEWVQTEYGIRRRKAEYLIATYDAVVESDVPFADLEGIGWSKLSRIAPMFEKGEADKNAEWVKLATESSFKKLEALIREAKGQTTGTASKILKLHPDQIETYEAALAKAKKEAETDVDAVAIDAILMAYLAGGGLVDFRALMKKAGYEKTLEVFDSIWPDIEITAVV